MVACGHGTAKDAHIRLNDVQVRGTHNSYQPPLPPLDRQLDAGIRQLELDVFFLPDGTFAVHHSVVDSHSICPTLDACLTPVRAWLKAHTHSLPLFLIVEDKDAPGAGTPGELDALDGTVRRALPGRLLVAPREVAPVTPKGWPTLDKLRGRVVPVLIGDLAGAYSANGTSLAGRSMLVYASSGPLAAITSRPDPAAQAGDIAAFVRSGLIVRTQADGDLPVIDPKRRSAALASGAQIVSARDLVLQFPGGVVGRCDPLVASPCRQGDLEPTKRP